MVRLRFFHAIFALMVGATLAGCGSGTNQFGSQGQNNGNSSVVLTMTDLPPSNVTILAAEATLTGATLAPGNVSLFSGSRTVELTRLQTDVAYIATATNIPAGAYTSISLTFANLSITFENDSTGAIGSCAVGNICAISPVPSSMSATVPLTAFTIASASTTGLLIDEKLDNLLNASLLADFSAGTTVTSFTPGGTGAPPVGAEDVVGLVSNINASAGTFTLTNAAASYALKVNSSSTFFQFPASSTCTSPGIACLQNNQIVSVDIAILSDGSIQARNILFEDADNSDAEVEGEITATNAPSLQFSLVVHNVSSPVTGLNPGAQVTVQYALPPTTPFDVDFLHIDNAQESTSSFSGFFTGPADLVTGEEVSIRRNASSSAGTIVADRVRLRSSRITATVQSAGSSIINLATLPSIFFGHGGVTQIQAQTSVTPPTIYFEIGAPINATTNITNQLVSVRGPLFNTGSTNRTLLATKVVVQ